MAAAHSLPRPDPNYRKRVKTEAAIAEAKWWMERFGYEAVKVPTTINQYDKVANEMASQRIADLQRTLKGLERADGN